LTCVLIFQVADKQFFIKKFNTRLNMVLFLRFRN